MYLIKQHTIMTNVIITVMTLQSLKLLKIDKKLGHDTLRFVAFTNSTKHSCVFISTYCYC